MVIRCMMCTYVVCCRHVLMNCMFMHDKHHAPMHMHACMPKVANFIQGEMGANQATRFDRAPKLSSNQCKCEQSAGKFWTSTHYPPAGVHLMRQSLVARKLLRLVLPSNDCVVLRGFRKSQHRRHHHCCCQIDHTHLA